MGWCGASEIYEVVAKSLHNYEEEGNWLMQKLVLADLYEKLTDDDWDCTDEAFGASPAGDAVLYSKGSKP